MRITNASSSVGLNNNEHSNVASESVTVFPHLTHHRAHTLTFVKRLNPNTQKG